VVAIVVAILVALSGQAAGQEGSVAGTLTVNGAPIALRHVYASAQPGFFDAATEDVRLLFSDAPLSDADRADPFALTHLARDGKAHVVEVVLDHDAAPISGAFYGPEFGGMISAAGMHVFTRERFERSAVAGRLYIDGVKTFDDVRFTYDVRFTAPIPRPPTPAERAAALDSPPARAARAYLAAVTRGTLADVLAVLAPDAAADYGGADAPARLADLRGQMPRDADVASLVPQADGTVLVKVQGHQDGIVISYTLKMVQIGADWRVAR
jgi:hypothetical protein